MKLHRLRGRKVNDYLRRKGNVWKGRTLSIVWLRGAPKNPNVDPARMAIYVGVAASTKTDSSAVKRNRMRRRCREALRRFAKECDTLPTVQLLLRPKIRSLDCSFEEIEQDIQQFFATLPRS